MAKKELVDNIIKLYSKLGGNMNNVLGSRSNITFLGTGKNPEPFVEMSLNMESVAALGKSKVLQELESPMGYLTANKLNDIQAGKLYENMLQLDSFFNPQAAPANITDMASGTRNLDAEGLGSLRTTQAIEKNRPAFDKAMQSAAKESEAMRNAGLDPSNLNDYNKAQEMGIISSSDDVVRQLQGIDPNSEIAASLRLEEKGKKLADSMSDAEIDKIGEGIATRNLGNMLETLEKGGKPAKNLKKIASKVVNLYEESGKKIPK